MTQKMKKTVEEGEYLKYHNAFERELDGHKPSAPVNCSTAFLLLQEAIAFHIMAVDKLMKQPASDERGKRLAHLIGELQGSLEDSKKP